MDRFEVKLNRELLPASKGERAMGLGGYFALWVGFAVIIATFSVGGTGVQAMTLPLVIVACIVGNLITGFLITLNGDVGQEHGIPSPMYWCVIFGPKGSAIPSVIRGFLACCWTGIQTYYGATAIALIIVTLGGNDHWFICYVIFLAVQIFNAAFGIKAIDRFATIAAPCIIIISIWIVINLTGQANEAGIDLMHSISVPGAGIMMSPGGVSFQTFMMVMITNASYWSTNAADNQTTQKYVKGPEGEKNFFKRNKIALCAHLIALPLTQLFCVIIGAVAMLTIGDWNPVNALGSTSKGVLLLVLLMLVVLAQWSTNIGTSVLPGAVSFQTFVKKLFNKNLPYKAAVIIVGVIALAVQPWAIMERLTAFLGYMGSVYGPITGIMIADYWVLRKRRLNVPDIYNENGQFKGAKGWNLAGIIAMILGVAGGLIFSSYAMFVSIAVGLVVYLILAKLWWFKSHPQAEIENNYDDKYLGLTNYNYWQDFVKEHGGTLAADEAEKQQQMR